MVRILFGLNGCSLLTSPKVSTVNGLEFNIASVQQTVFLMIHHLNSFHVSPIMTSECSVLSEFASPKLPPYDLLQEGFYAKLCSQNQDFPESVEFFNGPSLEKPLQVPFGFQQNLTHYRNARFLYFLFLL